MKKMLNFRALRERMLSESGGIDGENGENTHTRAENTYTGPAPGKTGQVRAGTDNQSVPGRVSLPGNVPPGRDDGAVLSDRESEATTEQERSSRLWLARQEQIRSTDSIVASCYCIGCLRASVEYPGTDQERWYCQRDRNEAGYIEFRAVHPSIRVRQCVYRIEG